MNKKLKLQVWMQWGALALAVLLISGVVAVKAYYGDAPKVVVEGDYIEAAQPVVEGDYIEAEQPAEQILGGFDPNTRCVNYAGDVTCLMTGSFINASTTIVSFADPFLMATTTAGDVVINGTLNDYGYGLTGATSTVDLVSLDIRGTATSTYSISCGASAGPATADSVSLLDTATGASGIATSSTLGIVENKLTAALGGLIDAGTVEKITLNAVYPYFVCTATSAYSGAFTEATNTFDGKYTVRVRRTQ